MKNVAGKFCAFSLVIVISLLNNNLFAQVKINQSVFSNGAAVVSNGTHKIIGTVGQPIIGTSASDSHVLLAGFWYQNIDFYTEIKSIDADLPLKFHLDQNFPNPFNPSTMIQFTLPKNAHVVLKLYDLVGREVTTLVDEDREAGVHQVTFEAGELPSGIYLYRIQADGYVSIRKLTLLK
ncbi:T9SS type A sorting domain-containing protein [candidate division KSB1 bacterium]|nr:T9SS type A sorting domain-containing protein [candidate division KSB1 bacterium]